MVTLADPSTPHRLGCRRAVSRGFMNSEALQRGPTVASEVGGDPEGLRGEATEADL